MSGGGVYTKLLGVKFQTFVPGQINRGTHFLFYERVLEGTHVSIIITSSGTTEAV